MKLIQLTAPGLDHLRPDTAPDPTPPGRGEALVQMRAASLNFVDFAVAQGLFHGVDYPVVPIADGAGEVIAVGAEVRGIALGDRVAVHPKATWIAGPGDALQQQVMRGVSLPGSLIEVATVGADTLVKAPPHLSWEEIAALPICATTAGNALRAGAVGPASTVVLLGTGGVSTMALQLAKAAGARVILTSSSEAKLARAKALGADEVINYRQNPGWDAAVLELTGGRGADLVVETVGAQTFSRSLAAARQGGTVFTVGFVTGSTTEVDLMNIIVKSLRVVGNNTGSVENLAAAIAVIGAHGIRPAIDQTYGLADVAPALAAQGKGEHFGKLALHLDW